MDTAIIMLIAAALGAGVAGGLLAAWGCERRTLGLKNRVDALEILCELLKGQLVAEIKRRAGSEGLDQRRRNKEIEDLARNLPAKINMPVQPVFEQPWWEKEQVKNGG
jgi:hypothetical protein